MNQHVGLIGCGLMGAPIAARLIDRDYEVIVFDKSATAMDHARELGCVPAPSPRHVGERASIALISLPRPEHVTDVVRGDEGSLLGGMRPGSVIVDTSTVDPATSQENASAAAARGVGYLDCPILGRPAGCGNWTLPAGGDPERKWPEDTDCGNPTGRARSGAGGRSAGVSTPVGTPTRSRHGGHDLLWF